MAADDPSEWDPGELLLYASEYLDMYRLFSEYAGSGISRRATSMLWASASKTRAMR
jgi:hypothetical protein